ncbi:hypothetical protein ACTMTF_15230 [Nonomuraea sp. ZG12]|uniref:hypothetical protein n=1 Tax=Nonomuraea sp. ZG12 TaxID=3452207 RepID=UPI003F88A0EA
MYVWRVAHQQETYEGFPSGPYVFKGMSQAVYAATSKMANSHSWDDEHPPPSRDGRLNGINDFERCGFDSVLALCTWFKGWEKALHDAGFIIYKYEVSDFAARVGDYGQTVFDTHWATPIGTMHFFPVGV